MINFSLINKKEIVHLLAFIFCALVLYIRHTVITHRVWAAQYLSLLGCSLYQPIQKNPRSLGILCSSVQISLCKLVICDLYSLGNREAFFNFLHS